LRSSALLSGGRHEHRLYLGIGGELPRAEGLKILCDGVLFSCGKGRDHSKKSNGKHPNANWRQASFIASSMVLLPAQSCSRAPSRRAIAAARRADYAALIRPTPLALSAFIP
jgi:hypothetical protein